MSKLQESPAEGSREVIERELARTAQNPQEPALASADDIARLLGDSAPVGAILSLRPSLADVEQAALWHQGDGDMLAKTGHPLEGKAAAIFDLLQQEPQDTEP